MAVPLGKLRHALIMAILRLYVGCIEKPRSSAEVHGALLFCGKRGATFLSELQDLELQDLSLPIDRISNSCLHRRGSAPSLLGKSVKESVSLLNGSPDGMCPETMCVWKVCV